MSSDLCRRRLHEEHLWAASDQVHLPSTKRGGGIVQWHLHVSVFLSFVLQKHMSEFFMPIAGTPKNPLGTTVLGGRGFER